jgi:hypothetical protein
MHASPSACPADASAHTPADPTAGPTLPKAPPVEALPRAVALTTTAAPRVTAKGKQVTDSGAVVRAADS